MYYGEIRKSLENIDIGDLIANFFVKIKGTNTKSTMLKVHFSKMIR